MAHIAGTSGNDHLIGSSQDDQIQGGLGDDTLEGRGGNDTIEGGEGDDTIIFSNWQAGDSLLLDGGAGYDTLDVSSSNIGVGIGLYGNLVTAPSGTGNAAGSASGFERFIGSAFSDYVNFTFATVSVHLQGGGGDDMFLGGSGDDLLEGGVGNDTLEAGAGNDTLTGGAGVDVLIGGAGNDALNGGIDEDVADYSRTTTGVIVNISTGTATGSQIGTDQLSEIENVTGGSGNDQLTGDAGANVLDGAAGNDRLDGGSGGDLLIGGDGADALNGGSGIDTADYTGSRAGVHVNLAAGKGSNGAAQGDSLSNIENLLGSAFTDVLIGNAAENLLDGGAGNDTLNGGGGADILIGGTGADTFVFKSVAEIGSGAASDKILDFEAGGLGAPTRLDLIDLSGIDANEKTAAKDDTFTFIGSASFSRKAGELRVDQDGSDAVLYGDVNGDGLADFAIRLTFSGTLDSSDFIF